GCKFISGPSTGVATHSQVTVQYANAAPGVPDATAVTIANPNTGRTEGCFADGGPQGFPLPGWNGVGSSSAAGQCYFSDLVRGSPYPYDFFSGACSITP